MVAIDIQRLSVRLLSAGVRCVVVCQIFHRQKRHKHLLNSFQPVGTRSISPILETIGFIVAFVGPSSQQWLLSWVNFAFSICLHSVHYRVNYAVWLAGARLAAAARLVRSGLHPSAACGRTLRTLLSCRLSSLGQPARSRHENMVWSVVLWLRKRCLPRSMQWYRVCVRFQPCCTHNRL